MPDNDSSDGSYEDDGATFVFNIDGTSRMRCVCTYNFSKTWLNHWRNISGEQYNKCAAKFCARPAQVGAHVREEGGDDRLRWIIPFCQKHNKRNSSVPIEIKPNTTYVRAALSFCE